MSPRRGGDASPSLLQRIGSIAYVAGLVASSLCVGVLLALSIWCTGVFATAGRELIDVDTIVGANGGTVLLSLLWALLLIVLCALVRRLAGRLWHEALALVIAVALTTLVGVAWVMAQDAHLNGFADSLRLLTYAMDAARGDWSSFTGSTSVVVLEEMPDDAHRYFVQYPYQSGVFLYFYLVCRLFPSDPTLALLILNVIADEVVLLAVYGMGRLMLREPGQRATLLFLLVACLPLHLSASLPYGNNVGLAAGCLFLYCQARAVSATGEGRARALREIAWVAVSLAPLCAVMVLKSTFILFAIAAVLAWAVRALRERSPLPLVATVIVLLLANAFGSVPVTALEERTGVDFGDGMPKTSWIVLGLDESELSGMPGWWDAEAWRIMIQAEGDVEEQQRLGLEEIAENVGGFVADPGYALYFFSTKLATEWCEPTFASLYYSSLNTNEEGVAFDPYGALGLEIPAREAVAVLSGYQTLVYLGALAGMIRLLLRRGEPTSVGFLLTMVFFAGFGCYLLWEAKSIYVLPFFVLLLPLAAHGIDGLACGLSGLLAPRLRRGGSRSEG